MNILFLCTGNSCRSQIAESLATACWPDGFNFYSAGTHPKTLDPLACRTMKEIGLDLSGKAAKNIETLQHISFDCVITVCQQAQEHCPVFPGVDRILHVGFDDPPTLAAKAMTEAEILNIYRRVRDEIKAFVLQLPEILRK
jgi:arsenate reductase